MSVSKVKIVGLRDDVPVSLRNSYLDIRTYFFLDSYRREISSHLLKFGKSEFVYVGRGKTRRLISYREYIDKVCDDVKNCNKDGNWRIVGCPKGCLKPKVRPFHSCNNHYCLICAAKKGRLNGRKIFEKLRSFSGVDWNPYFMYFVFTVPDKFWSRFMDHDEMSRWRDVCRLTLSEFYGCVIGGVERDHSFGDIEIENIYRDEPHLNYLLPSIGFFGKEKRPKYLKVYLSKDNLKRLRKIYSKKFRAEFGLSRKDLPRINLFYSYIKNFELPKLLHKCNYICRSPLEVPFRKEMSGVQFFSKSKMVEFSRVVLRHFEYYKDYRSIRWFGWLHGCVFKKYLRLLDYDDVQVDNIILKCTHFDGKVCAICRTPKVVFGIYLKNKLSVYFDKPPPLADFNVIKNYAVSGVKTWIDRVQSGKSVSSMLSLRRDLDGRRISRTSSYDL